MCSTLHYTAAHCNTMQPFTSTCAAHCNTLQNNATIHVMYAQVKSRISSHLLSIEYIAVLQHIATQCNTLQHTATHCNTPRQFVSRVRKSRLSYHHVFHQIEYVAVLQHTATHCNTLQQFTSGMSKYSLTYHHVSRVSSDRVCCITATHCNTLQQFTSRTSKSILTCHHVIH